MTTLAPLTRDLSVFQKLELEQPPVGVKFLYGKPDGIPRLEGKFALCEMVIEAQKADGAFYSDINNHECVGTIPLGMVDEDPLFWSGHVGTCLEIFKEARATRRVYRGLQDLPALPRGTCNFVAFAPLGKLAFDPDVLVVYGTVRQAEILLRAMSYTTGQPYEAKGTTVLGCAWTLVYPYMIGKINFWVAGLTFGHITRGVGKEGSVIVSLPWDCLPTLIENLGEMPWVPPSYAMGRAAYTASVDNLVEKERSSHVTVPDDLASNREA